MTDAGTAFAEVARALAGHLRFQQALGVRDLPLRQPAPIGPAEALARLEAAAAGCTRCKLSRGRNTVVFGSGDPRARLVVIGEGPGEDEDRQGKPFVGRAGELLTRMLASVGISREEVYICNVVKCRPPGNRKPEADEVAACAPHLAGQLEAIAPGVVAALGASAAQALLGTREAIGRLRGRIHPYRDAVLIPTYHPAFLLRNPGPEYRRQAYEDLKMVRREYDLARGRAPAGP